MTTIAEGLDRLRLRLAADPGFYRGLGDADAKEVLDQIRVLEEKAIFLEKFAGRKPL